MTVDPAVFLAAGIGPVVETALLDAAEDLVELLLAHQEGVVLDLDFHAVGVEEGEGHLVAELDIEEEIQVQHYALDRKSTRLNSSHVAISYAVFCLKKKNQ